MPDEIKPDMIYDAPDIFEKGYGLPQTVQIPAPPQTVIDNIVKPNAPSVAPAPAPVPDKKP